MRRAAFALSVLALASGLGASPRPEPLVLGPFVGTLPCADCPGLRTRLTLTRRGAYVAEGTYRLEETYLERSGPIVSTGEWTTLRGDAVDDDAVVYQLEPDDPGKSRSFVKLNDRSIRILDGDFRPVPGPRAVLSLDKKRR